MGPGFPNFGIFGSLFLLLAIVAHGFGRFRDKSDICPVRADVILNHFLGEV
jgi:hypothetical protein